MEKRRFTIEIYNRLEWFVEIEGEDDFTGYSYLKNYGFAKARCDNKGRIDYLFDISIRDEDLELAKEDKRFQEICIFTHDGVSFEGTFYDALVYIKKERDNG